MPLAAAVPFHMQGGALSLGWLAIWRYSVSGKGYGTLKARVTDLARAFLHPGSQATAGPPAGPASSPGVLADQRLA